MAKVIAVGIKKLYYADPAKVTGDLTGTLLATIIKDVSTKQVENIHQDTWSIEEEEPSTTEYRNQLTNGVYRQDTEMGNIQMSFTIGQYDYEPRRLSWAARGRRRHGNVREASRALKMHDRPDGRQPVLRLSEGLGYRP